MNDLKIIALQSLSNEPMRLLGILCKGVEDTDGLPTASSANAAVDAVLASRRDLLVAIRFSQSCRLTMHKGPDEHSPTRPERPRGGGDHCGVTRKGGQLP